MTPKSIGFICGILIGIIAVIIVERLKYKKGKGEHYDERQEIIRGRGFKYGFYAFAIQVGVLFILSVLGIELPIEDALAYIVVILVSGAVTSVYDIIHDAYAGIASNRQRYTKLFILIFLINMIIDIVIDEPRVVDGKLSMYGCVNFVAAAFCAILACTLYIRHLQASREEE